jgi:hypothetical protein
MKVTKAVNGTKNVSLKTNVSNVEKNVNLGGGGD